jgi:hypothetical protein
MYGKHMIKIYQQRLKDYCADRIFAKPEYAKSNGYITPVFAKAFLDALYEQAPDLFREDSMTNYPVADVGGRTVEAFHNKLLTRLLFTVDFNYTKDELLEVADSIAAELRGQWRVYEGKGDRGRVFPYLPAVPTTVAIDPRSFEPYIHFQTIVGIAKR